MTRVGIGALDCDESLTGLRPFVTVQSACRTGQRRDAYGHLLDVDVVVVVTLSSYRRSPAACERDRQACAELRECVGIAGRGNASGV